MCSWMGKGSGMNLEGMDYGSVFRRKMTGEEWRLDARCGDTN